MSALASSSALRLLSARQSLPALVAARRCLSSSALRWNTSSEAGHDSTPARAHRTGTDASRAAGGPDVDPLTKEPRNASTASSMSAKSRGAEALADLAQGLTSSFAASSMPPFTESAPLASSPAESGYAVPSGYSTETLPLKTDPTLEAFVNNLMKDGKKASATRHIIDMLQYLSQALHADPLPAVQAAILAAGPLVRMQTKKTGGKNIGVPVALGQEQSRRRAIIAIIEASKKRNDKKLSVRLAREVIAVLEGSSSTLAKKEDQHRLAMVNRSNMIRV